MFSLINVNDYFLNILKGKMDALRNLLQIHIFTFQNLVLMKMKKKL